MNNSSKISIQDLTDTIALKSDNSKKKVESFIKIFHEVIEKALVEDGIVKIKGLGTFKRTWNEARKSVNIQTGEEFIIPGHSKVSFVPEAEVKDTINNSGSRPNKEIDPLAKLKVQAAEIVDLLDHLKKPEPIVEEPKSEPIAEAVVIPESVKDEVIITPQEEEKPIVEEKPVIPEVEPSVPVDMPKAIHPEHNNTAPKPEALPEMVSKRDLPVISKINGKKFFKAFLIILLVLGLAAAGYLFSSDIAAVFSGIKMPSFESSKEEVKIETPVVEQPKAKAVVAPVVVDTVKKDTVASAPKVESKAPVQAKVSVFEKERTYTKFITTIKMPEKRTFASIATEYYKSPDYWVYIYEANKGAIKNPGNVPPGTSLKIPVLDKELIDISNQKTIEYAKKLAKEYAK